MAALGVHQHGIDDERIALPLPPRALRPAGQIDRVAPLEHDAFDRVGIGTRLTPDRCARRVEVVPGRKRHQRREIDARFGEPRDERFKPLAPPGERQLAQILRAVGQQIVSAQMRGKFGHQLCRDGLAVEPLLQHVEGLHALLAHDQKLAINRARKPQRVDEIGKTLGNIFAGARIEPRR